MRSPYSRRLLGSTLLEVAISSLLVGVLLVGAMNALASATKVGLRSQHRIQATQLARALQAEIASLPYEDLDATPTFGPEGAETSAASRSELDDVDDFHTWSESPIVDRFGNVIAGLPNWQREVTVTFADPTDFSSASTTDQGIKRIRVSVSQVPSSTLLAESIGYQTTSWSALGQNEKATQRRHTGNRAPVAKITANKLYGSSPLVVNFSSAGSFDLDGDAISVQWNFSNGATSSATNPTQSFTNTTALDQTFEVQLQVTDPSGAISTANITVLVLANE